MTSVSVFDEPLDFRDLVEPLLAADRGRSTVLSTATHGAVAAPPAEQPFLAALTRDGAPVAAALQTPPHPLTVLGAADLGDRGAVFGKLADAAVRFGARPSVISGPPADVDAMAAAWAAATGAEVTGRLLLLLYRLGTLADPGGVPGAARSADVGDPDDLDLLARWFHEFEEFTRAEPRSAEPDPDMVRQRAARGSATIVWESGGTPVAVAGHSAVVGGMARIGPVYTPERLRGNRFGSAVTAAAVHSAWRNGATEVVLFTDAGYPTSNHVYQRLGFVEVGEFVEVFLRYPDPRAGENGPGLVGGDQRLHSTQLPSP